jgi:hypothetical protein
MEDGLVYTDIYVILPEIKLRHEENGGLCHWIRESFFGYNQQILDACDIFILEKTTSKSNPRPSFWAEKSPMTPLLQRGFQDPKMEVPYHIRLCFVAIFPEI